ncbi:MAG: phosphopantothenate--cysteine ligase [Clostridiales Family XIII bacterium]|jgi:phosphopantothenate-cysteine ligase|nr:phosphopantothenate--cysteine ligase [Clostridiales Family XIII bacterium]
MNVLITAGGNTEKIDDVRAIRNTGTGRLGALVAEKVAASGAQIFYVCDRHAVTPRASDVTVIHADNVTALETAVREVCSGRRIDAVVHSMAVSDYQVRNVTTVEAAARSVETAIRSSMIYDGEPALRAEGAALGSDAPGTAAPSGPGESGAIEDAIMNAPPAAAGGKISSGHDDLLIMLKRAPKIISMFRSLAPDAMLVGFKLLSGVSEKELVRVGLDLLRRNGCDYVLANDMDSLRDGGHTGHLIAADGAYTTYEGKDAIAGAIAAAVEGGRRNG